MNKKDFYERHYLNCNNDICDCANIDAELVRLTTIKLRLSNTYNTIRKSLSKDRDKVRIGILECYLSRTKKIIEQYEDLISAEYDKAELLKCQ